MNFWIFSILNDNGSENYWKNEMRWNKRELTQSYFTDRTTEPT